MERTETAATAADLERGRSKIVLDGTNTPMYDPGLRSSSMGTATGGDTTAYAFQPEPTSPITTSHRSQAYKYLLLGVFCLGVFIDGTSLSWHSMSASLIISQFWASVYFTSSSPRSHMISTLNLSNKHGSS